LVVLLIQPFIVFLQVGVADAFKALSRLFVVGAMLSLSTYICGRPEPGAAGNSSASKSTRRFAKRRNQINTHIAIFAKHQSAFAASISFPSTPHSDKRSHPGGKRF
jgi:hypothetical protein